MADRREDSPTRKREGSWVQNERDRLTVGREATPAQRLAWLEEMIRVAYRTGALPRRDESEPLGSP
ncbi:MAG: hypothetical protein ACJ77A_07070 [Actinomycetota bacterium]